MTPSDVHKVANAFDVKWDDDPDFMRMCHVLVGKTHLDDMSEPQLAKIARALDDGKRPQDFKRKPTWGKGMSAKERFVMSRGGKMSRKINSQEKARFGPTGAGKKRRHSKVAEMLADFKAQPHQKDVTERTPTEGKGGMVLNWGLGSGKTAGAFSIAEKRGGEVVVVTPASLRVNFKEQFDKFVTKERKKHYHFFSYEQFRKDPQAIVSRIRPKTLIADEVHRLRNASPRAPFEAIRGQVPYMIGLTGSLVNNRPEEMVPLVNLIAGKKVYKNTDQFQRQHIKTTMKGPGFWGWLKGVKPGIEEHPKNLKSLGKKMSPYIHRFTGDPKFQEFVPDVTEKTVRVPMSREQLDVYKFTAGKNPLLAWKIKNNLPPSKSELKNMNAFMAAMRQASNSPAEFDKRINTVEEKVSKSPKFKAMLEEIRKRAKKDKNFRSVVFSNFLQSGVDPVIAGARARGLGGESFTGKLNDKERAALVKAYNKGDFEVLGLSPAGGEGLDLKGVKLVQLTEPHWNPERSAQAIGRAARFKSHAHLPKKERSVLVQRMLAVHPDKWHHDLPGVERPTSADEWIDRRRQEKENLNRQFVRAIPTYDKRSA